MPRPEFEQVVAQATREYLEYINLTAGGTVGPGEDDVVTIFSPPGTVSRVNNMFLRVASPSGATEGSHTFSVIGYGVMGSYAIGTSNFDNTVQFGAGTWRNASLVALPPEGDVTQMISNILFDDTIGLTIIYTNATDVDQTEVRYRTLVVSRRQIAG